jgi:hypothetical protein
MGAKMGRFDKVACLRFDERTEKADLRLWEYNPSSSVGRLVSRRGEVGARPDLAAAGPPTPPRSDRDHVTCSAATANAPPLVSITRVFSGCTPPRSASASRFAFDRVSALSWQTRL